MPPLLRFARYREIAAEIASRLASSTGEEFIVSSGGLAMSATAELLRQTSAGAASVRLSTIDTFARRLVNDAGEYPRVASEAERRLAMRTAIRGISDPMMTTRGIAAMLERSYRDVRDAGMTLAEFDACARDASLRNRRRIQMIVGVWRAYETLIAELQAIDPAEVLARAATLIETNAIAVAPQVVAGFYDMTGAQLRIVSALASAGKLTAIDVPAGEGDAYAFASRFVKHFDSVLSPQSSVLHIKKPAVTTAQYDNKEVELRAVCRSIRELLDGGTPAAQIGIVTRLLDPDDVRLLERFAGELGFATSEQTEVPLIAHRLGRAVATILRLAERNFPRAEVIDILRDGFAPSRLEVAPATSPAGPPAAGPAAIQPAGSRRYSVNIDRLDVATRKARVSGGRSSEIRNPENDSSIEDYRTVVAELEALTQSPGSMLTRFPLRTQLDLTAAEAIDDVASLLRRAARWKVPFDSDTMIDLLEQQVLRQPDNPTTRQPVVWLGDVMTFRGRTFEHLFAIRMQEGSFPQRRIDDPLLPDSDRRQLGLREIGDGRDEERLLFQLMLDGANRSIHFSLAGSDGFGKVLRPSPFIKRQVITAPRLADNPTTRQPDNLSRQLQLIARSGTRSIFDGYLFAGGDQPAVSAAIANALQAISPTQLEDYGECPQKFLFKHILGVFEYDDPDRELQMHRREKGKLDHTILERFYRSIDPHSLDQTALDDIVDAAFDEEEARVPPFNRLMRNIERRATKRNLHAFVAEDIADLLASGLQPRHFEYKFGPKHAKRGPVDHPEPFSITASDIPIRVEGVIDRIDEGNQKLRIVDYKSGKALRHVNLADKIDRGVRLQLALYAMAVAEFFDVHPQSVSGAIKPLIVRGVDNEKLAFQLGLTEARLRETLELFVTSMLRGVFPAFPNDRDEDFNSCKYCPVSHSCRTRHSDAERRAVLRQNDPRTLLESLS
jgi:RecB family exonuclease